MPYQLQGRLTRLRALRVRKEIPSDLLKKVIGCDMSDSAIDTFKANMALNDLGNIKRR